MVDKSSLIKNTINSDVWWEHPLEMTIKTYGDDVLRTHSVLSFPQQRDRQGISEEGFNC